MTQKEIKQQITDAFMQNVYIQAAYGLQPGQSFSDVFSLVSFENILFDIISYAIALLSQFMLWHRKQIDEQIATQKTGRLPWYRYMILQYQHGFNLLPGSDKFDNTGATPDQIAASKIIKYAAVVESDDRKKIIIKIAGENNGELQPIDTSYIPAVEHYVDRFKYAGTRVNIINFLPDLLYLTLDIYYNPLVLDGNGRSIRYGNKPVEEAIQSYMKELPFNGELVLAHLIDKLQAVEGVEIPHLLVAKSSWIDTGGGYSTPQPIDVKKVPVSGYFKVPNFDNINYVVSN